MAQGFGNVGQWAADFIQLYGGVVVAVSDRNGALYNEDGLNVLALRRHVRAKPPFGGHLSSFPGGEWLAQVGSRSHLLEDDFSFTVLYTDTLGEQML